jgi:hypothetical protein
VKAWENQTARRALKGGTGISMALTLAACGGGSDDTSAAPAEPVAPTTPVENLVDFVNGGITEIMGADPVVVIPNVTAGADADLTTTIGAGGTGTLTMRFTDAEDTVTLDAASDLTGYTALAITAGTVDVTAVDLSGIATISVNSGVKLTSDQFLALTELSAGADGDVTIVVSSAADADKVIAAAAKFSLATGSTIAFENATGGTFTAADKASAEAGLDQALLTAKASSALPAAIENLQAAEAAEEAAVDAAAAKLVAEKLATDADVKDITADELNTLVDDQIAGLEATVDGLVQQFLGTKYAPGAFNGVDVTDATQSAIISELDAAIEKQATDFAKAVSDAKAKIVDADDVLDMGLVALTDKVFVAGEAADDAYDAKVVTEGALTKATAAISADPTVVSEAGVVTIGVVQVGLIVKGEFTPGVEIKENADGTYTVAGNTEVTAAEYSAYTSALVADVKAGEALAAAEKAFDAAIKSLNDNDDGVFYFVGEGGILVYTDGDVPGVDAPLAADPVVDYVNAKIQQDNFSVFQSDYADAKADWTVLKELDADLKAADDAVLKAVAAIETAPDAAKDPGLGIDVVKYDTPANTNDDQLYIYDADAPMMLGEFGVDGVDYIYFGTEYNYVSVDASALDGGINEALAGSLGSASTLDVFAITDGIGTLVYVEDIATAGNGTTDADMTVIVVQEGLDAAEHLAFNSDTGILSAEGAGTIV